MISTTYPNHVRALLPTGSAWATEPKPDPTRIFTPGRRFYVCSARPTVTVGVWELELVDYDEYRDYQHVGREEEACGAEAIRVIADEVAFDHVGRA